MDNGVVREAMEPAIMEGAGSQELSADPLPFARRWFLDFLSRCLFGEKIKGKEESKRSSSDCSLSFYNHKMGDCYCLFYRTSTLFSSAGCFSTTGEWVSFSFIVVWCW